MRTVAFVFALLTAGHGNAEAAGKNVVLPVFVEPQCDDDPVGQKIAFKTKEAIRASISFSLADESAWALRLSMVCIEPDEDEKGLVSSFAYTIELLNTKGDYDFLVVSGIRTCGLDKVDSCADSFLVKLDSARDDIKNATVFYPDKAE